MDGSPGEIDDHEQDYAHTYHTTARNIIYVLTVYFTYFEICQMMDTKTRYFGKLSNQVQMTVIIMNTMITLKAGFF